MERRRNRIFFDWQCDGDLEAVSVLVFDARPEIPKNGVLHNDEFETSVLNVKDHFSLVEPKKGIDDTLGVGSFWFVPITQKGSFRRCGPCVGAHLAEGVRNLEAKRNELTVKVRWDWPKEGIHARVLFSKSLPDDKESVQPEMSFDVSRAEYEYEDAFLVDCEPFWSILSHFGRF